MVFLSNTSFDLIECICNWKWTIWIFLNGNKSLKENFCEYHSIDVLNDKMYDALRHIKQVSYFWLKSTILQIFRYQIKVLHSKNHYSSDVYSLPHISINQSAAKELFMDRKQHFSVTVYIFEVYEWIGYKKKECLNTFKRKIFNFLWFFATEHFYS